MCDCLEAMCISTKICSENISDVTVHIFIPAFLGMETHLTNESNALHLVMLKEFRWI